MTQSNLPDTKPESSRRHDAAADTEPLLHLHKMSTTAGLGSQEYVAINVTAVVAVVFGLASVLCILGYLLLVIPVIGIVLSLIALRQIHNSNGTQTGRAAAWTGLVLAGGITAVIGGYNTAEALHRRADDQALYALCAQLGQDIAGGNYQQAYQHFSPDFQARIPLDQFLSECKNIQVGGQVPRVVGAEWNGLADFQTDSDGVERAVGMTIVHYQTVDNQEETPRLETHFLRGPDGWKIDSIGELFPEQPNPKMPREQR
jgi:hypothetical protein